MKRRVKRNNSVEEEIRMPLVDGIEEIHEEETIISSVAVVETSKGHYYVINEEENLKTLGLLEIGKQGILNNELKGESEE